MSSFTINTVGTYTLYMKEVKRFLKVYNQTLLAPVVTAMLFLAVFNLAMGNRITTVNNIPFGQFMAAGLIVMSSMQNAFANTSSSFTMGKVLGTIIDYLMPPLSPGEITFAMVIAGITRGVLVGTLVGLTILFFIPLSLHSVLYAAFYLIMSSMMLALLGMIGGIFSETFDHMAAVTSYVITPLAFLSGTFYSVKNLPEFWFHVSQYNPFFYMIDGFRYGMTGYHDSDLLTGVTVVCSLNALLWLATYVLLKTGYRIKH